MRISCKPWKHGLWFVNGFLVELTPITNFDEGTNPMKFASAYYIPKQDAKEIVVFIDEPPSELPEEAVLIVETTDHAELSRTIEPYWLMVSG